jgi:hypothetical protein
MSDVIETPVVEAPAPVVPLAPYSVAPGHDRRVVGSSNLSPTGKDRRVAVAKAAPVALPLRARFLVTEINNTSRGATVLTMAASYDGYIPKPQALLPGASPVGSLTIEVDPTWAAKNVSHGSAFLLTKL